MKRLTILGFAGALIAGTAAWGAIGGGDILMPVQGAADVLYGHDAHVTKARVKCAECHYSLYTTSANHRTVTMEQMRNGASCGACHNGKRAFSVAKADQCGKCHKS